MMSAHKSANQERVRYIEHSASWILTTIYCASMDAVAGVSIRHFQKVKPLRAENKKHQGCWYIEEAYSGTYVHQRSSAIRSMTSAINSISSLSVRHAMMLQMQASCWKKIMVPMMQLSHLVFWMCSSSWIIHLVTATDVPKQQQVCNKECWANQAGKKRGDATCAHGCDEMYTLLGEDVNIKSKEQIHS